MLAPNFITGYPKNVAFNKYFPIVSLESYSFKDRKYIYIILIQSDGRLTEW